MQKAGKWNPGQFYPQPLPASTSLGLYSGPLSYPSNWGYPAGAVVNQIPQANVHHVSVLENFLTRPGGMTMMPVEEANMLVQGAAHAQNTTLVLMNQTKQALAIASEVQTMQHVVAQGYYDKPAPVLDKGAVLLREAGRIMQGVLDTLKPICETTIVASRRAEDGAQHICCTTQKPYLQARAEHAVKHARESRDFAGRCVCKIACALDQHHAMYGAQSVAGDVAQVVLAATACMEACRFAMFGALMLRESTETILDIQVTGS